INSEEIFEGFKGKKEAQEKYDKEVETWQQKMEIKQKEIQDLKEKASTRSLLMSKEGKEKLEHEIERKSMEYQKFVTEIFGRSGKAFKKNAEYTKPIVERIMAIIRQIAKEENYDFIFDTVNGGLVHAKPDFDLTKRVLKILNSQEN
ncbi:MAG: OmpH family outer membrane protein, partial [bacterium]